MVVGDIISTLERFAPLSVKDSYDNAGLQLGLAEAETAGVLLCIDVTESVVEEACELGVKLIVSHHPLLFKPLKSITGRDYIQRCVMKAIKNDIAIYSAHTNLDNCLQGVNGIIADKIGLRNVNILHKGTDGMMKAVIFVPSTHEEQVKQALFAIGCGKMNGYEACSYENVGNCSFKPLEGATPFMGKIGETYTGKETRIEMVFPQHLLDKVCDTIYKAHPYEVPAFDLLHLANPSNRFGSGIIGDLPEEEDFTHFAKRIKELFSVQKLAYSGRKDKKVRRVAVCGGAGSFLIRDAAAQKADVFITGEIKYHEAFEPGDMNLMELGHYESEQFTVELLKNLLAPHCPNIFITRNNTNSKKYI